MSSVYKWFNNEKSRYYQIIINKRSDKIELDYKWGGINNNRRRTKKIIVQTEYEVEKIILIMLKRRKSRGYKLIVPIINRY